MKTLLMGLCLGVAVWAQEPAPAEKPAPPAPNPAPQEQPQPANPAPTPAGEPQPGTGAVTPPAAATAATFPYWGQLTGSKVRLRGGAGDFHAILQELPQTTPVRVLGKEGSWLRVEVPGGLAVWVALAGGSKPYLQEKDPGQAVVMVDDLMIRGTPSTEFPPLGRLNTGDRVMILDKKDDFARVLAPSSVKGFVHEDYVSRPADQAAISAAFLAKHAEAETALLQSGAASRELVARADERKKLDATADRAFSQFETEKAKPVEARDLSGTKEALTRARDELPAGDPKRQQAEEMLGAVDEWQTTKDDLARAKQKLADAERLAKDAETKFAKDLEDLRKRREEVEEAGRHGPKKPPYVAMGWVRRTPPTPGAVGEPPHPFALHQGDNTRLVILESDRYDLTRYTDRLVGVLVADGPSERPGLALRVLKISKLEILE